jgi:hypothetical protein
MCNRRSGIFARRAFVREGQDLVDSLCGTASLFGSALYEIDIRRWLPQDQSSGNMSLQQDAPPNCGVVAF